MKHLLKCTYLVLGIMLVTYGCQNDNFDDSNLEHLQDKGNNLFKKGKLSDYNEVKDFVKSLKNSKHSSDFALRSSLETSNDFIILEHQDMAIHNGDAFNTYTIPIVKFQQQEDTFSNLVVQFSVASDSSSAYILTYTPNPGYLEDYALDDRTAFSGDLTYEFLDYDGSLDHLQARVLCETITITYCRNGQTGGIGPTHQAGPGCVVSENMWVENYTVCTATDDGGSDPYTIEPPEGTRGGGSGNNGTTNSPNTGSSTSTIPADIASEVISILSLNPFNDQAAIDWLNDTTNFSEVIALFLYLDQHTTSVGAVDQEALDFAELALEALVNDAEIIYEENIIFESSWNNLDCQKSIVKSSTEGFGDISNSIQTVFANNPNISLTYKTDDIISPPNTLIGAKTTSDFNSDYNVENINITFNNTFLNQATDLMIFSIAIHENLHAILTVLLENSLIEGDSNNAHLSFLVDEYAEYKANWIINQDSNYNPEDLEFLGHEVMSDLINDIAQEIKAYGESKGYNVSDFHYEALAWSGLTETVAFITMDSELQDGINEIIDYELTNFSPLAEGVPCN